MYESRAVDCARESANACTGMRPVRCGRSRECRDCARGPGIPGVATTQRTGHRAVHVLDHFATSDQDVRALMNRALLCSVMKKVVERGPAGNNATRARFHAYITTGVVILNITTRE